MPRRLIDVQANILPSFRARRRNHSSVVPKKIRPCDPDLVAILVAIPSSTME